MSPNLSAPPGEPEIENKAVKGWGLPVNWGFVLLCAGIFWYLLSLSHALKELAPVFEFFICLGGTVALGYLLIYALHTTALTYVTQSRLAFLGSSGTGVFFIFLTIFGIPGRISTFGISHLFLAFVLVVASLVGSLLGCLMFTVRESGLWENNSPPPDTVRQAVLTLHQTRIGNPEPVQPGKRLFDLLISGITLVISAPIWMLTIFIIWYEDPGPIFFVKNSVGRGGINFQQLKFRTMIAGAEEVTGPVLASEQDNRILHCGTWLRKTALDELPQLFNIFRGEMSFVGPRPQRTVLVYEYLLEIPEYAERHRVLPGLSGLAQVAGDYYLTPRQKLRFDRLYIRHSSLGFDIRLILLAFLITFWYRWQPGWNRRLPRRLLHKQRRQITPF